MPPLKISVSSSVEPSKNSTCPVGAARPEAEDVGETVAVNVTESPEIDGFSDDCRLVWLPPRFTTWINTGVELAPMKLGSPTYCTTIECDPIARVDVVYAAEPSTSVAVSMTSVPS